MQSKSKQNKISENEKTKNNLQKKLICGRNMSAVLEQQEIKGRVYNLRYFNLISSNTLTKYNNSNSLQDGTLQL